MCSRDINLDGCAYALLGDCVWMNFEGGGNLPKITFSLVSQRVSEVYTVFSLFTLPWGAEVSDPRFLYDSSHSGCLYRIKVKLRSRKPVSEYEPFGWGALLAIERMSPCSVILLSLYYIVCYSTLFESRRLDNIL